MKRLRAFMKKRMGGEKPAGQQGHGPPQQAPMQGSAHPKEPHSQPQTQQPSQPTQPQTVPTNVNVASDTLTIALTNNSQSSNVFATVTGRAIDRNGALVLLQSDGRTPYFPNSPSSTGSAIGANVAIHLGAPGSVTNLTVPHIAGGRIYFSIDTPLNFFLNPGPALVEPSVANPSDTNYQKNWTFAEFTFNRDQLYANISYVDFVSSIPLSFNLTTLSNQTLTVAGLVPNGLAQVASALQAQTATDRQPWDRLIIRSPTGANLRVISPNLGRVMNPTLFNNYFEPYVNQVYSSYTSRDLQVNTQAAFGTVTARTAGSSLGFSSRDASGKSVVNPFAKPSTGDIFSCSTGPFATGNNAEVNAIIPRLAAAFNRSTLMKTSLLPASQDLYYQEQITNHYSRVVHKANGDGRGYAFPYDDVQPSGGRDESGAVFAGDPKVFGIRIGAF